MPVSAVQPLKALSPIEVSAAGRVIEAREVQPLNTCVPIVVTVEGIVTLVSFAQSWKSEFCSAVTPLPIFAEVSEVQP